LKRIQVKPDANSIYTLIKFDSNFKQLQLIQILRIKAQPCVNAGFAAAKAGRVNPAGADANGMKAASGNADIPSGLGKLECRSARNFTAW
jgi:hypothetical protein